MPNGLIIKGIGGVYTVKSNNDFYDCKARGVFRNNGIKPLPGDRVEFEIISDENKEGIIVSVFERKNQLIRPAVANVDQIAILMAVESPNPDAYLIDKLIISAYINNAEPLLCVNKCDLNDNYAQEIFDIYNNAGIKTIMISAKNNIGIDILKDELAHKITVFAGQSGVGKSTSINVIFKDIVTESGELSDKTQRGKQTTRHIELFEINEGYIIDSPGFSSYEIDDMEPADLSSYYPEFIDFIDKCRFNRCIHVNEPNCAVKDAVSNGIIDKGRYERYVTLVSRLKEKKDNKYL